MSLPLEEVMIRLKRNASANLNNKNHIAPNKLKLAAVAVIFLKTPQGLGLLFTKRAAEMLEHAGQISFPGGAVEKEDPSYLAAALRESQEEIGIAKNELRLISVLPHQKVLDKWLIHPYALSWPKPHPLTINPSEVDKIIIASLNELLQQHPLSGQFDENAPLSYSYKISNEILWGATAAITARILDCLINPPPLT